MSEYPKSTKTQGVTTELHPRGGYEITKVAAGTHPRSEVLDRGASEHASVYRMWTRVINGTFYSFTLVVMNNGEVRIDRRKFNGYVGGPQFGCAWTWLGMITVRPEPTPKPEPIAFDVEHEDRMADGWAGMVARVDTIEAANDRAWFLRMLPYSRNVRIVPVFAGDRRERKPAEAECEWCGQSIRLVPSVSVWYGPNGSPDCTHAPRTGFGWTVDGVPGPHNPLSRTTH